MPVDIPARLYIWFTVCEAIEIFLYSLTQSFLWGQLETTISVNDAWCFINKGIDSTGG